MKKKFTLVVLVFTILNSAYSQISCVEEGFNLATDGWIYSQGAGEDPYNNPANGCAADRGILTPGVGGNNPADIKLPVLTSTGAKFIQLSFDVFVLNANLNCASWKDYTCPTSIDIFYFVGATKYIAITDLVLPANGPTHSPRVNVTFNAGNNLPVGTSYQIEIVFKPKSGIGNCNQPGTKYVLDNFKNCEVACNDCTTDAKDDMYCNQATLNNTFIGNLATNDVKFTGAQVAYSLANGPFANGNSLTGGAILTINSNGTFTLVRTDITKSIFDFTYRMCDQVGQCDLASAKICFQAASTLPVVVSSFNASRKNNTAILNWKTESESNTKSFEIEKKVGNAYVLVGTVSASNRQAGSSYTFTDNNTSRAETQYRLKLVDRDNKFSYTAIKIVKGLGAASDFSVFPNPGNGYTKISITDISASEKIQLLDNSGRMIKNISTNGNSDVELNGLVKGLYLIRLVNNTGQTVTKKLIVN